MLRRQNGCLKKKKIYVFIIALVCAIALVKCVNLVGEYYKETTNKVRFISSNIPQTVESLTNSGTNSFNLTKPDDWLALQELSKTTSLEGYTFQITRDNENGTETWNLALVEAFTGIGSEEYPFKGTLQCAFESGKAITTDCPIFTCLGTGAVLTNIEIITAEASSGVAAKLVGPGTITMTNVKISGGTINNSNASQGAGAFGEIINSDSETPLVLSINSGNLSVNVSSVTGYYAGYIAGKISGNVDIIMDFSSIVAYAATNESVPAITITGNSGGSAGSCFGYIDGSLVSAGSGSVDIVLSGNLNNMINITGSGNTGGVIGYCKNTNITTTFDGENHSIISIGMDSGNSTTFSNISANGQENNVGGFCGKAQDSSFEYIKINSCNILTSNGSNTAYAGGLIGMLVSSSNKTNTTNVNNIEISRCYSKSSSSYAGGVIGYVQNDGITNLELSYITNRINNDSSKFYIEGKNSIGGIIGGIKTTNDKKCILSNIELEKYSLEQDGISKVSCQQKNGYRNNGGAIGIIDGNCEISNAIIDFSAPKDAYNTTYSYIGGIVGYVNNTSGIITKIKLDDIFISGIISDSAGKTITTSAQGGFIGGIEDKIVVEIDGENNISNVKLPTYKGNYVGQIVGMRGNSLVYLQAGATVTKSTTGTEYLYMADEIGNYGGVIKNAEYDGAGNGLLIINDVITGNVTNSNNYYQINSKGDLIRLAIALNTECEFGKEAFNMSESTSEQAMTALNTAKYKLNTSVDLTNSGVYSLSKNVDGNKTMAMNAFSGELIADNNTYTITNNITSYYQDNLGLFAYVDGARIENITICYDISLQNKGRNTGGIAAFATGDVIINNVNVETKISDCISTENKYMGGLFGEYIAKSNSTLNIIDCLTNISMNNKSSTHYTGGLIGYYYNVGLSSVLNLSGVTISGTITSTSTNAPAYIGGLVSHINGGTDGNIAITIDNSVANTYGVKMENLDVISEANDTGGLFGYKWDNVNAVIKDIVITNGSSLNVKGRFGGLINIVSGKMSLENIDIQSLTVTGDTITDVTTATARCGLLIRDGSSLYLSVKDYVIDSDNVFVTSYGDTFDEIVGYNKSDSNAVNGGIISISYSDKRCINNVLNQGISQYSSYINQVCTDKTNEYTRYYYDLDTILATCNTNKIAKSSEKWIIDSADKMMVWHLVNYANSSIKSFFMAGFSGYEEGTVTSNNILKGAYSFTTDIDLNTYSYYPTNISGGSYEGNGNSLTFYGKDIDENEISNKQPHNSSNQHYKMHAGLFDNISYVSLINGFELMGTINGYKLGDLYYSGALITGSANSGANLTISNIFINNLWVNKVYESTWTNPYGLLIANVSTGADIFFDTIVMKSYITDGSKKAASALIGNVGSESATNINLEFINMDIASLADEALVTENSDGASGKVLACASFIYNYNYYEQSCSGLYTFTKDDYLYGEAISIGQDKYVTLGRELADNAGNTTVEYYDVAELVGTNNAYDTSFSAINYKPYVCNYASRYINVNPKTVDMVDGCGTYEDPYVISSAKNLAIIGWYLSDIIQNASLLDGWTVNKLGDDDTYCMGNHVITDRVTYDKDLTVAQQTAAGFPTQEELASAYYIISDDIDLSAETNFSGLGTKDIPFVGVIAGKNMGSETYPTITMPVRGSDATADGCFGLIKYAKGAAITNLNISFLENNYIKISDVSGEGAGGAVYGYVMGGDNIIDNVKVNGTIVANTTTSNIAGYIGIVGLGGVILRNMEPTSLSGFSINCTEGTTSDCANLCGIVGNVLDGYVVYEESANSATPLMKNISNLYSNSLEPSKSYDILNASYLKSNADVIVSYSSSKGFTFNIDNPAELQVYSMALNSGTFNYSSKTNAQAEENLGYNFESRCRTANYAYVGNVDSTNNESASYIAYSDAINNDNINGINNDTLKLFFKPYLFDFITFNNSVSSILEVGNETYSLLNKLSVSAVHVNNLEFTQSTTYDMSVYGKAFRGLGSRYTNTTRNAFRGNINGNNASIAVEMIMDKSLKAAGIGLINNIWSNNPSGYTFTIKNITITGNIINGSLLTDTSSFDTSIYEETNKDASAIVANLNAVCSFSNVNIHNCNVRAQGKAAGYVVTISDVSAKATFNNCSIDAELNGSNVAYSIEGIEDTAGYCASVVNGTVEFTGCRIENVLVQSYGNGIKIGSTCTKKYSGATVTFTGNMLENTTTSGKNPATGGFVGYAKENSNTLVIAGCLYNNIIVSGRGNVGGMLGHVVGNDNVIPISITGVTEGYTGENTVIKAECQLELANFTSGNTGGVIGYLFASNNSEYLSTIEDIKINNMNISSRFSSITTSDSTYVGGIIGVGCGYINISNTIIGDANSGEIFIGTDNTSDLAHCGGIIGGNSNGTFSLIMLNLSVIDCKVLGVSGESECTTSINAGNTAGGIAGSVKTENINVNNFELSKVKMNSLKSSGGAFGYASAKSGYINIKGINIANCNIDSKDASGGIIGKAYTKVNINNAIVNNSIISAMKNAGYAGGIAGAITTSSLTLNAVDTNNIVSNSYIFGKYCGGAIGYNGYESRIYNLEINNNRIIGAFNSSGEKYTGGVVGGNTKKINICNVKISNNYIASNVRYNKGTYSVSSGGMLGKIDDVECKAYNILLENNCIGALYNDNIIPTASETEKSIINTIVNLSDNELKECLYYYDSYNYVSASSLPTLTTDNIYKYTRKVGEMIGYSTATTAHISIVNVEVVTSPDMEIYRPVIDVGTSWGLTSYDSFYNYSTLAHIIYGNYDYTLTDTDTNTNREIIKNSLSASNYEFDAFKAILTEYNEGTSSLRQKYRLDKSLVGTATEEYSLSSIYNGTFYNSEDLGNQYLSYFRDDSSETGKIIPMIVYKAEYGSLDDMIKTYINVLTNNGGAIGANGTAITQNVSVKKAIVSKDINNKTQINISNSGISVAYDNETTTFSIATNETTGKSIYDTCISQCEGTFSIICISYKVTIDSVVYEYVLQIPIFIESMLEINSHMRIIEGYDFSIDNICENGGYVVSEDYTGIMLNSGSNYTVFSEYIYSTERNNYSSAYINKKVNFYSGANAANVLIGTRLTLIDVTDDNKAYYYDVTEDNITEIPFTSFTDNSGNAYTIKNICNSDKYTNVASYTALSNEVYTDITYERFIIFVDQSAIDTSLTGVDRIYSIKVSMDNTDATMKRRVKYTEKSFAKYKEMSGTLEKIDIESVDDNGNKYSKVVGSISENGTVTTQVRFDIKARNSTYWAEKEGTRTNIYFELALSIQNSTGSTIAIPPNTKVNYKLSDGTDISRYIANEAYINYYLDNYSENGLRLSLDDLNSDLIGETIEISFDFSSADLSTIENGNYNIYAELIRTSDPDFPRSGTVRDQWSGIVTGESEKELGFAMETEELINLGKNIYQPEESDSGNISFKTKLDFNDFLEGEYGIDSSTLAEKKYRTDFEIYKKVYNGENNTTYVLYTGDDINIYPEGTSVFTEANAITNVTNDGKVINEYTGTEIENGISLGDNQISGIVENGYILYVNTDSIEDDELTNYKVVATMDMMDYSVADEPSIPITLQDYYIFTIAKLKKDL